MSFINGLLLGLILQLSVGPVFFAVLHTSMSTSHKEAMRMICGVALVDTFYIALSFTGISALLTLDSFNLFIKLAGAGILIYFGTAYLRNAGKTQKQSYNNHNSFIFGLKLTLSNPLTILFWTGIFGTMISSGTLTGINNIIYYSLGCVSATILFLNTVALTGKLLINKISEKHTRYLDYTVGLFFIFFALVMAIR